MNINKTKIMNWKDVYQLPLKYDGYNYAWAENGTMTLMFDGLKENERKQIVSAINGESEFCVKGLTFDGCEFYVDREYVFCVRGWGRLTGTGGLNLGTKKAEKIQDEFIKFIANTLTQK